MNVSRTRTVSAQHSRDARRRVRPTSYDVLEPRRLLATIAGTVYDDANANGRIDSGERGLAGIEVFLDADADDQRDAGEDHVLTDAAGGYAFDVTPGTYRVVQARDATSLRTLPGSGRMIVGKPLAGSGSGVLSLLEIDPATALPTRNFINVDSWSTGGPQAVPTVTDDSCYVLATGFSGVSYVTEHSLTTAERIQSFRVGVVDGQTFEAITALGDELFVRETNSDRVHVLDRRDGTPVRTLTLPTGTGRGLAAMPDRHALLTNGGTELRWIDPETGEVVRRTRISSRPLHTPLAYHNGRAFVGFAYSNGQFEWIDVETGRSGGTPTASPDTDSARPLSNDAPWHLIELADADAHVAADFARVAYTPDAQPPVVLSTSGTGADVTWRVAIHGTQAGASLALFNPSMSVRDRITRTVPAQQDVTVLTIKPRELIAPDLSMGYAGLAVSQSVPGALPQIAPAGNIMGSPSWSVSSIDGKARSTDGAYYTANARPEIALSIAGNSGYTAEVFVDDAFGTRLATFPFTGSSATFTPATPLPEGRYSLTLFTRVPKKWAGPATVHQRLTFVPLVIDQTPPTATASYVFDDTSPALRLTVSESFTGAPTAADLTLERLRADGTVEARVRSSDLWVTRLNARDIAVRYVGGVLADGRYRLTLSPSSTAVRDLSGNVLAPVPPLDFFILAGDANRDRKVDFDDLLILAQNYGATGKTFSQGNFNYSTDGTVDFDDLLLLAQRYGTSLLSAPPTAAATPAAARRRSATSDVLA